MKYLQTNRQAERTPKTSQCHISNVDIPIAKSIKKGLEGVSEDPL